MTSADRRSAVEARVQFPCSTSDSGIGGTKPTPGDGVDWLWLKPDTLQTACVWPIVYQPVHESQLLPSEWACTRRCRSQRRSAAGAMTPGRRPRHRAEAGRAPERHLERDTSTRAKRVLGASPRGDVYTSEHARPTMIPPKSNKNDVEQMRQTVKDAVNDGRTEIQLQKDDLENDNS